MTDQKPKRPGGRPPKFTGEVGRMSHSLRLQPSVDSRIRSAAAHNFRSIAEELESRVKSTIDGVVLFPETPDLRKALQVSAEENGRPITVEAEARLVESFEQDRVFGRPETYALLAMLANDIARLERDLGMSWLDAGETPNNTVAEDLIAAFTDRVIWELSRADRVKARGLERRMVEQSPQKQQPVAGPAIQIASQEELAGFDWTADPKRPPELFDGSDFADLGTEDVGPDYPDDEPAQASKPTAAPRRRKAKA